MKISKKLLIFAFISALLVALMTCICFASPEELKPGSDRVIFLEDAGTGSGGSPDSAFCPIVPHANYNPERKDGDKPEPNNHLNSGIYQATEMLKDTGGTIVICGPVVLGNDQSTGYGTNTKDVFTAEYGENTIKYTSVYNGVDYRETNNASITITEAAELTVLGQSIWENVTFITASMDRLLSCGGYDTLIGEGIECRPSDELMLDVPNYYLSISAGHRYLRAKEHEFNLTVKSGTYGKIIGSQYGTVKTMTVEDSKVNLVLEGTTKVIGEVIGTIRSVSTFSGDVNITVNGGTYACDFYGASKSGFSNTDSTVNITVNGGEFDTSSGYIFSAVTDGFVNNPPSFASLNLQNAPESTIAQVVFNLDESSFTKVIYPSGKTAADFTLPETTTAEPEQTQTEAVTEEVQTTSEQITSEKKAQKEVKSDSDDSISVWLIVVIIVAALVVAGIVVYFFVIRKKKSEKKDKE